MRGRKKGDTRPNVCAALSQSLQLAEGHPLKVAALFVVMDLVKRTEASTAAIAAELGVDSRTSRRLLATFKRAYGDMLPPETLIDRTAKKRGRHGHPVKSWCSCVACKAARAA